MPEKSYERRFLPNMKQLKPKIHASTQHFIEIQDIVDSVVILGGSSACMVIEITANNFALLSKQEQDAKIFSYASLLNSLSFPIQIFIRNERVDVSSYLKLLEQQEHTTQNQQLKKQISLYRDFIKEMVLVNTVLNKKFYVVLTFSSLEAGAAALKTTKEEFATLARKMLQSKADALHGELLKIASNAKILEKEELVKLFYDIFNHEAIDVTQVIDDVNTSIIAAKQ